MRFIGSKAKLLPLITRLIGNESIVADVFSGSCTVGRHLRSLGYIVWSNDWLSFAHRMAQAYICATLDHREKVKKIIEDWNFLDPVQGLVARNYGGKYFIPKNAGKIDAVIADLRERQLEPEEYALCVTSIIEAADDVANTTGVYAAYLKKWTTNARRRIIFRVPNVPFTSPPGLVTCLDALHFVKAAPEADVYYLDPPYNSRQYHAYYHIPEVICCGIHFPDVEQMLYGKTGLMPYPKSKYCQSSKAAEEIITLLRTIDENSRVILSYNNEGLLTQEEIKSCFVEAGRSPPSFGSVCHKRYTTGRTEEWLFYDE